MQHLRASREAKRLKREALANEEEEEEECLPKELVARVDVSEEEPEKVNDSDSDSEDSEDEEDCETTDNKEQEPVQANTSALDTLIASSQKLVHSIVLPSHTSEDQSLLKKHRAEDPSRSENSEKQQKILPHCTPFTFFQQFLADPQYLFLPLSLLTSARSRNSLQLSQH